MKRTTVLVLAVLVVLAGCGSSQEEQAEERRVAAEKALTERLQTDLDAAVDAVAGEEDAKGRMPLPDAVEALEAKGYTAGSVPSRPVSGSGEYCVWLVDPESGRSFVRHSVDEAGTEVDEEVTYCDPKRYPPKEAPAPTFGDSPADQEALFRSEQTDEFLRENLAYIADRVGSDYVEGPIDDGAVSEAQKKEKEEKIDTTLKTLEGYEARGEVPSAGWGYGVGFSDKEFCAYAYHQVEDGQAWIYQSLTEKTTRAEPGTTTCDAATALP